MTIYALNYTNSLDDDWKSETVGCKRNDETGMAVVYKDYIGGVQAVVCSCIRRPGGICEGKSKYYHSKCKKL